MEELEIYKLDLQLLQCLVPNKNKKKYRHRNISRWLLCLVSMYLSIYVCLYFTDSRNRLMSVQENCTGGHFEVEKVSPKTKKPKLKRKTNFAFVLDAPKVSHRHRYRYRASSWCEYIVRWVYNNRYVSGRSVETFWHVPSGRGGMFPSSCVEFKSFPSIPRISVDVFV